MARPPSSASLGVALVGFLALAAGVAATVGAANDGGGVRRTPVVDAVRRAAPAVVSISTTSAGPRAGVTTRGSGSGVLVHPDGWVVTNSHVIRGAARVVVETSKLAAEQVRRMEAALVEDDPAHDLALLKVAGGNGLPYVGLRSTRGVLVGETAIAVGNPYGLGDSVTVGIVSALGRGATLPSGYALRNLLQTDASINFGNSGGALLDLEGDLLGINSSVHPQAQGIAFSVSADDVKALLDRNLIPASRATPAPKAPARPSADVVASPSPLAGLSPAPPPRGEAAPAPSRPGLGMTLRSAPDGVLVGAVEESSAAEIAGLVSGDVILEVDGVPAGSAADAAARFRAAPAGRAFLLSVRRGERRTKVVVVVPAV